MKTTPQPRGVSALAGWFGGNRMLASHVGEALRGCHWVCVLFAGGMSEIPHIKSRTLLVNDKHKLIINLARVVADPKKRLELMRRLRRKAFHPDELKHAQHVCKMLGDDLLDDETSLCLAENYFVASWMGRSGKAGTADEFNGRTSARWNSNGGDSVVRYRSALRALTPFSRSLKRCSFDTMDAIEMAGRCEDTQGHGIYADPPFPGPGRKYIHNAGRTDAEELAWHTRLRDALLRFERARVVCRFYDHPMIRELYPDSVWSWQSLVGRKQSNEDAPEVLLVRNASPAQAKLF